MTHTPLTSLPSGIEVPLLNHGLDISSTEAAQLWAEGQPLPEPEDAADRDDLYIPDKGRVLRSADGKWVVRRMMRKLDNPDAHAQQALSEFERLQEYGVDVISRTSVPAPGKRTLFTISPYIPDLELCEPDYFNTKLAPKLQAYITKPPSNGDYLSNIYNAGQYSTSPDIPEPFLHDVDPFTRSLL